MKMMPRNFTANNLIIKCAEEGNERGKQIFNELKAVGVPLTRAERFLNHVEQSGNIPQGDWYLNADQIEG